MAITTAGVANGFVQGNLCYLAEGPGCFEFAAFANAIRSPARSIGMSVALADPPTLPDLGDHFDIRTDVPRYRVSQTRKTHR